MKTKSTTNSTLTTAIMMNGPMIRDDGRGYSSVTINGTAWTQSLTSHKYGPSSFRSDQHLKKNLKQSWLPAFWKKERAEISAPAAGDGPSQNQRYNLRHALFFITSASLVLFSFRQPPTSNWHKISWINCLFFSFYVVCSLKKRTSSKICTFCPVSSN